MGLWWKPKRCANLPTAASVPCGHTLGRTVQRGAAVPGERGEVRLLAAQSPLGAVVSTELAAWPPAAWAQAWKGQGAACHQRWLPACPWGCDEQTRSGCDGARTLS